MYFEYGIPDEFGVYDKVVCIGKDNLGKNRHTLKN